MFANTNNTATIITNPIIIGLSRLVMLSQTNFPTPGQEKIVSVNNAPASNAHKFKPMTVIVGIIAFLAACFNTTSLSVRPLDRAVRT